MKNARHFLLMVATLLCSIAVRAEGATALPQMSTDLENPVFYTISNTRSTSGKYLYYAGDNVGLRDANDITLASLFYFTGTAEACYIHNAATTKKVASVTSWTDAGIEWTIGVTPYGDGTTGLCICPKGNTQSLEYWNEFTYNDAYTTYAANDAGSVFVIEPYTGTYPPEALEVKPSISSMADADPTKCYTINTAGRGAWAVDAEGTIFSSTSTEGLSIDAADARQQFAILSANGTDYYLYSVSAKKFVAEDASLVPYVGDAIAFADASSIETGRVQVRFRDYSDAYINLGNQGQMTVDSWGTIDNGNAVLIAEAGDFDAAEAMAILADPEGARKTYLVAQAQELLAANADNHSSQPALGQYGTSAYEDLSAIVGSDTATAASVEHFIAAFEVSKCLPVFTIDGVNDYAAGMSIYDDGGQYPRWKATDSSDETMLWAFDMTDTIVGVTDKVVIRNLATGNLFMEVFYDVAYIRIAETTENIADDGLFLMFREEDTEFAIWASQSGVTLPSQGIFSASSTSAWKFTYVGTTYGPDYELPSTPGNDEDYDLTGGSWGDATDNIVNADLSSKEGWTVTGLEYDNKFDVSLKAAEFYAGWNSLARTEGYLKQEVTLPAGIYRLTGKAFFRQGENPQDNPSKSLGYLIAGDNKVLVKTLGSANGTADEFPAGADALYADETFDNVLEFTLTEETTLNIGYETTFDVIRSWFIVGALTLEKKITLKDNFMAQAEAFLAFGQNNMTMYSLNAVQEKWSEVMAVVDPLNYAISEGEKVLKTDVEAAMELMATSMAEMKPVLEYYEGTFASTKLAMYDIQDNSTANSDEVRTAFEDALTAALNVYSVTTVAELEAKVAEMEAARQAYVLNAVPAEGFSFDYTFLVEGVGNSTNGWVKAFDSNFNRNYQYQNSDNKNTETLKKKGYIEAWNNGANFTGTLTYEATLPNGYYTVSAYAFTDGATSFVANTDTVVVEKTGMYVQPVIDSVLVKNGKMTFGLNIEGATWVGITNIELAYTGDVPADTRKAAFVERYTAMEVFSQEQLGYAWNGINNTYFWPVMDAAMAIKDTIDNVTDMALLDSMMAEMDKAEAAVLEAYVVGDEYNVIKNLFWNAADNSVAATDEVRMAMEMALENSNYAGYNIATIEALETAVADIKAAYLAYVTNAIANEGYKFDATFMLVNPSFETGDLTGWEANKANDTGVKPNTDGTYTMAGCDGDYLFNTWYGTGIYVQQTVKELPAGTYALSVVVASDDILLNITAGNKTIEHLCQGGKGTGSVVVVDSVAHEGGDFFVKVATVNNDWFKADNFQLHCLGVEDKIDVAYLCGATESTEAIYNALVAADYNVTALNYDDVSLTEEIVANDFVGKYDVVVVAGNTGSGTNLAKTANLLVGKVPVLSTKSFWYKHYGANGTNPGTADAPSRFLVKTVAEHPIFGGIAGDTITVFNDMAKSTGRYLQGNGTFADEKLAQTTLGTANGTDCIGEAWVGDMGWLIIPVDGAQPEGYLTEAGKALFVNAVAYLVAGEKYEAPVVEVATVTLDKTKAELTEAGATVQLTATVAPENATDKAITWTSSDEKVATVDANGLVTAVANGTATITATAANGVKAECVITVKIAVVDGIEAIETVENAVIYTITGKAVQGDVKTLERGIYIINGKKVLVK